MAEFKISKRPDREPTHPGVILADALVAMDLKIARRRAIWAYPANCCTKS